MEGNTPMIGTNDSANESFSTSDATELEDFAREKGIQELSFWTLDRDTACATSGDDLLLDCAVPPRSDWRYSRIFNKITTATTPSSDPPEGRTALR
jgi:chitinase